MSRGIDKKGVSIMIGYILLVSLAITMGIVAYNWMKSYVPSEMPECPDGVSVLIKDINCTISQGNLEMDLLLKNNGRFDLSGYFIYGANSSEQEIATIDLSQYDNAGANSAGRIFLSTGSTNSFSPNQEDSRSFIIPISVISTVAFIQISPVRYQELNNRWVSANCGKAKVIEDVTCA